MTHDIESIKRKLFHRHYRRLNSQQQEAVYTVNGPVLILAGAGSGKTTVLVNRIAHIVQYGDAYFADCKVNISPEELAMLESFTDESIPLDESVLSGALYGFASYPCPPDRILAITFTNKAAREIKNRLESRLGSLSKEIWAGTFHSFCARLLRMFADYTPYRRDFLIYDTDDCKKVIQNILKEKGIEPEELDAKSVLGTISNAKNRLQSADDFIAEAREGSKYELIGEIYRQYQEELLRANAMDFDDLIGITVRMLQNEEEPRKWCQNKFRYILVDEYQDTNHCQYQLIEIISQGHGNIMVVGDDDQSIYKFRGAAVENILNFDRQFPNTKVILMENNYRSTRNIIEAANGVIANNRTRRGKTLKTTRDFGMPVQYRQLMDQEKEAVYIAETITEIVMKSRWRYSDIAVLYRTNAQSNVIEKVFSKSGIPHRMLSGTRFYDRAEVKNVIAYLRFLMNQEDFTSFSRIINVPRRGIGNGTIEKIVEVAKRENLGFYKIMRSCSAYAELTRLYPKISSFVELMEGMCRDSLGQLPSETVRMVIERTGYLASLEGEENADRRDNINELISSAIAYEGAEDHPSLAGFLEEIALISDIDNYDSEADSVVMMTVHSSKGLEFPVVFIAGMEENLFPSPQSSNTNADLEEERRLCYVAMTRAMRELYLTGAYQRMLYGHTSRNHQSRFLLEIPERYIESTLFDPNEGYHLNHYEERGFAQPTVFSVNTFEHRVKQFPKTEFGRRTPSAPSAILKDTKKPASFAAGSKVLHKAFGKGIVKEAKPVGSDILYTVQFESCGEKKLMGTYAKLTSAE